MTELIDNYEGNRKRVAEAHDGASVTQTLELKWNSVKRDGNPTVNGVYWVYAPTYRRGSSSGKENHNGIMFSQFRNGEWGIEAGYHKRPGCVTHWMPLPAEPEEEWSE